VTSAPKASDDQPRKRRVELQIVEPSPHHKDNEIGGAGGGGDDGWGGGAPPAAEDRPVVQIVTGRRDQSIDEAERHLVKHDLGLFQRGRVVRVAAETIDIGQGRQASALHIIGVSTQHMRERFTRVVQLEKFDKRARKWLPADTPPDFAEAYLERRGIWKLPVLRAVTTAPVLRADGSILDRLGFDRGTGIYYSPRGVEFSPVPAAPTRDDALQALDFIKSQLLPTFDFVDEPSRAVALSLIFAALLRNLMVTAPLHAFSAPVPGSGKSKLVNLASVLRSGHAAAVTTLGERSEEAEKRLGAMLIAGDALISIDNIERPLGGELLNQLVTEPLVDVRVLGQSAMVRIPNVHLLTATGNNLRVSADMVRRTLLCRLDPGTERPELREFETPDPVLTAAKERPRLVAAVLTIARAFFLAGCPSDQPPVGSFPDWSKWVRGLLLWIDEADPIDTIEQVRSEDPFLAALSAVLHSWRSVIGDKAVSAREVIAKAEEPSGGFGAGSFLYPDLREALLAACGGRDLTVTRLGTWLGRIKGRRVEGMRIDFAGRYAGAPRWKLIQ
jgi:hypothetical protein